MLKKIIIVIVCMFAQLQFAQDKITPWALSTGINAIDIAGGDSNIKDYLGLSDLNIIPLPSKITLSRFLNYGFVAKAGVSLNTIDEVPSGEIERIDYQSVDLGLDYHLKYLIGKEKGWFDPYGGLQTGVFWLDGNSSFHVGPAIGTNIWINKKVGINLETGAKYGLKEINHHPNKVHFQHSISVIFKFGARDKDKDGVIDKNDQCPEVYGLAEFNGCPDTDNDGIEDSKDECPNKAGTKETKGCPDKDGDKVKDAIDECPTKPGTKENKGCPDTDGDGVLDKNDKCINEKGEVSNNGCPKVEKVILEQSVSNKSELTSKVSKLSTSYKKTVLFEFDSAKLTSSAKKMLDDVITDMKQNPTAKFEIEGYTDSIGNDKSNILLGENRAANASNYIVSKGIAASRLKTVSFGELRPIADNTTAEGRQKNRRVVIKVKY